MSPTFAHAPAAPALASPAFLPRSRATGRGAAALALGLTVGALTSYGQTVFGGTVLAPLFNSVSAWLVVPFVAGMWMCTPLGAIAAGFAACGLQVIGYDATSVLRGYASPLFWTLFWLGGAVLGGPLLGLSGHAWRRATQPQPAATPAPWGSGAGVILAAAFLTEGVVSYGMRLSAWPEGALFTAIGAALAWRLTRTRPADLRWLAVAIPLGVLGQLVVGAITSTPFTW